MLKSCICPWLYQARLTDSKQSLALIDHIDLTLTSLYVVWPLMTFSLSFLSHSITASLQEMWRASRSHEQTDAATLTPAAGSLRCNYVRPCPLCFHSFVYKREKLTSKQKGDSGSRQLTPPATREEDKTRRGNKRVEEKLREKDSLQEQINSDFLFVSFKPATFLQRSKQGTSGRQIQWSTQPENDQQEKAWQKQWGEIAKSQYRAKHT